VSGHNDTQVVMLDVYNPLQPQGEHTEEAFEVSWESPSGPPPATLVACQRGVALDFRGAWGMGAPHVTRPLPSAVVILPPFLVA
jgi:hypothetical protein